jgi:translocation and assembly module TamB
VFQPAANEDGSGRPASARGHVQPATLEDAVDLAVDSSLIDLGVVQGFTSAVTDVTGSLDAHLHVTGAAADPHPEGVIAVQNGAATLVAGGVHYTGISGRIEFQADRVHIDKIAALDNHQSPLSIVGDLALHEREIGAVSLRIEADDFKVIDNDIGNVRVDSRLGLTGELRSPRLEGDLSVTTGNVNLDEVIALTGPSAYATTPIEFEPGRPGQAQPAPNPFDALQMDVHLTVPDDLLVKASDLQAAGAPIGLGALSVTLGGDLRATKAPGGPVLLTGEVGTIRGTYQFQGRRFEILRDGAVRFAGTDELNPTLDLRTRRVIQGVEALVNVRGTLRQPEVVLSSTPPLEQADILSLIVFNQPINELGQEQQASLLARAEGLAAGAVAGQIAQSIGGALGLETFELNLAPENGNGPQLTLGQQLGQSLYLKVEQNLGSDSATNVILEYAFTNWLRLQTNVIQNTPAQTSPFRRVQSTGGDLIFQFSH